MNRETAEVLFDWSNRSFEYGSDNCCEFVGDVLESMFEKNPMDSFHYTTKEEARAAIAAHGTLVDAINSTLGPPVDPGEKIMQGDVVVCRQTDDSWIAGVVIGDRIAVKTGISIMDWPLEWACYRWRM